MSVEQLRIIAPERSKHSQELFDLLAKVFSETGYYETRDIVRTAYINNSHYDWSASRIGIVGDRIVTHWGVWRYQMRIGSGRVQTGGVGAVATDGDFRKRGLMSGTARMSLQAMRELGYDTTLLFGIGDFYDQFGYVQAWPEITFSVSVNHLPKARPTMPVRRISARPDNDLAALYNRYYATATGTAVRPTYVRYGCPWDKPTGGYVWAGSDGAVAGYLLFSRRGDTLTCSEYCGDADQALRVLGMLARRWHCPTVRFRTLPYNSELCRRLRRRSCTSETRYRRSGGAMIHLLNLPAALKKMIGELSRRLRRSHLADWHGRLLISRSGEQAMLAISRGSVKMAAPARTAHSIRGGEEVAQLLIGTAEPGEVVEAGKMRLSGDAGRLADVLFPEQRPQLSQADRF